MIIVTLLIMSGTDAQSDIAAMLVSWSNLPQAELTTIVRNKTTIDQRQVDCLRTRGRSRELSEEHVGMKTRMNAK